MIARVAAVSNCMSDGCFIIVFFVSRCKGTAFLGRLLVFSTNSDYGGWFFAKILRIHSSESPNCSPNWTYAFIAGMGGKALYASRITRCRLIVVVLIS